MLIAQFPSVLYAGIFLISPVIPPSTQPNLPVVAPTTPGTPTSILLVPSPSSNAARLLVEPKSGSFARMANPQSFQNNLALQQLYQQRALQDARLEQCQEKQEEFEQCFFYGTGGIDRMDGMGLVGGGGGGGLVGARYPSSAGLASTTSSTTVVGGDDDDGRDSGSGSSSTMTVSPQKTKTVIPTW